MRPRAITFRPASRWRSGGAFAAALVVLGGSGLARAIDARVHPARPRPGDPVLVSVEGAAAEPSGTFSGRPLRFWRSGAAWRALSGLPVEQVPGEAALRVSVGSDVLDRSVPISPPEWRERVLKVARSFTKPSNAQKRRQQEDQAAFSRAWAQPFGPPLFSADFMSPREAPVTAPFGDRRVFNGHVESQHYGLDLEGRVGDPVVAANDGKAVMVRSNFSAGKTVVLSHGAGLFTTYFHLSRIDVKDGQVVRRGQRLGRVGKTGRVTGPHLHFSAKIDGLYVDPQALLALPFAEAAAPAP